MESQRLPAHPPSPRTCTRTHIVGCTNPMHEGQELVQGLLIALECSCCLSSMGAEHDVPIVAYNCGTLIAPARNITTVLAGNSQLSHFPRP